MATETRTCPGCGAALPPDAPRGLCPRGLIRRGLEFGGPPSAPGGDGATPTIGFELADSGPVLTILAQTIGAVPRVLLRDTQPGEPPAPLARPGSPEIPLAHCGYRNAE